MWNYRCKQLHVFDSRVGMLLMASYDTMHTWWIKIRRYDDGFHVTAVESSRIDVTMVVQMTVQVMRCHHCCDYDRSHVHCHVRVNVHRDHDDHIHVHHHHHPYYRRYHSHQRHVFCERYNILYSHAQWMRIHIHEC
jgi:hypothetical protein